MKTRVSKTQAEIEAFRQQNPDHKLIRVNGCGPSHSRIMIVGEAPGAEEELAARRGAEDTIMVGSTGHIADQLIRQATNNEYHLRDFYRTNVEKYRPPYNKLNLFHLINKKPFEDLADLWNEIYTIKPKVILAFGGHALKALTGKSGITKYRGSILPNSSSILPKVIPTFHPASFLHGKGGEAPSYKASWWVKHDIRRAIQESAYDELNLPVRTLESCHSADQFRRFLALYEGKKRVSCDIEVVKSIPTCLGFAFSKDHAISVPLLNYGDVHLSDTDHSEILEIIARIFEDPTIELIGQNWKFDQKHLERPWGFRFRCKIYMDTGMAAHTLYPEFPKKLEFLTSIFTREPYYKDELRDFDFNKDSYENILLYNAKDVAVPYEIHEILERELKERNLWNFFQEFVMPLHGLYMELENEGINSDPNIRLDLWRKYSGRSVELKAELDAIAGWEVKVRSSTKDIPKLLSQLGLPRRDSYDEDNLVALLGNHAKKPEQRRVLDLIITLRKVERFRSAYLGAKPDYDGRMRTLVNINGAETGRTSDNVLKPPERPHVIGLPFKTLTKHGEIGPEIRETLVVDPGYCFMEIDSSQAEARVVALLARDYKLLEEFNTIDVHRKLGGKFFGKAPDEISGDERFIGKTGRHSGSYGAGKRRWMISINTDARRFGIRDAAGEIVTVTEKQCAAWIEIFHLEFPNLRGVYFPEVAAALRANKMILRTPFGRERMFTDRWDDSLLREAYAYIPQSTVGDNTKRAMLYVKQRRPETRLVIESHDSFTALVPVVKKREYAILFKEAMELPIDFANCSLPRGILVIPSEIKIGMKNLREMEKYKP